MRAAILTVQMAALSGLAFTLIACTEVDKCRVGEEGCICTPSGGCDPGLQCELGSGSGNGQVRGFCRSGTLCEDKCKSARDGTCDDGGPDSLTSLCEWGSDCADCGERSGQQQETRLCTNGCATARDGTCDDGGEGSPFSTLCLLGSDCADCGPRQVAQQQDGHCSDTCKSADDGFCDDGGEGHVYDRCDWSTDCTDCGIRYGDPP